MRCAFFAAIVLAAGCSYSPTGPTSGRMTLSISRSSLPVGASAIVTATIVGTDRALVSFNSSLGTFTPPDAYAVGGVATSTFTATRSGIGAIGALSGSVAAEQLQVRVGDFPALAEVTTTPPVPTVFLSCNSVGTAGTPTICSMSGSHLQTVAIHWGDESSEQSVSPTTTSVAHVFPRAGSYTVIVRGEDRVGQVVHVSATATIVNPAPPPPAPVAPTFATSVFMAQEANAVGGCAVFSVSATAGTGATITSFLVEHGATFTNLTLPGQRVAICGLVAGNVVTAKATDSSGTTATYPLIVK